MPISTDTQSGSGRYLGAALPMFKIMNQINIKNGSPRAAALDLVQRHIVFEQDDGKDLNWAVLRKTLSPDAGPGRVSVKGQISPEGYAGCCDHLLALSCLRKKGRWLPMALKPKQKGDKL